MARKSKVKVCGITEPESALVACRAGASFIGVIFAKSSRTISPEQASAVTAAVRSFGERTESPWERPEVASKIPKAEGLEAVEWFSAWGEAMDEASRRTPLVVGVFMDQDIVEVSEAVKTHQIDVVQLHGSEDAAKYSASLSVPCIKVLHIPAESTSTAGLMDQVLPLKGQAAMILLDTKVKGQQGGTGVTFDWAIAKELGAKKIPFLLAGGLNVNNIKEAVEQVLPWGVDASSCLEAGGPGVKDHELVKSFVQGAVNA